MPAFPFLAAADQRGAAPTATDRRVAGMARWPRRYYSAALEDAEASGYTLFRAEHRLDR